MNKKYSHVNMLYVFKSGFHVSGFGVVGLIRGQEPDLVTSNFIGLEH